MKALPFEQQPQWVIDVISNGCGGKGSVIDPPDGKYGGCCDRHDLLYTIGGSEKERHFADGEFLVDMIRIGVREKAGIRRFFYLLTALLYFYAVHLAGKRFFRYGTPLSQEELEEHARSQKEKEEEITPQALIDFEKPKARPQIKEDNDLDELRKRLKEHE